MDNINNEAKLYKQALRSLNRRQIINEPHERINTSRISIEGLLVKLRSSEYHLAKQMMVRPEWIRLWYKVSEGEPFDLTLWEELSQPERNFLFRCISTIKPEHERDIGERHRKEAKQLFDRLYISEGEIKAGNNSRMVYKDLSDAIAGLMERHLISKNLGGRLKGAYGRIIGRIDDAIAEQANNSD